MKDHKQSVQVVPLAERQRRQRVLAGTAAVYVGAAILLLAACETFGGGGLPLPRFWYVNRTLWIGLGFVLIPAVIGLQSWRPDHRDWRPEMPGMRFRQILVYSRDGCHLCDDVISLLESTRYSSFLPPVEVVDIAGDPDLEARFKTQIPVVECDGRIRFRGRVSEILLRRLIEGTPPRLGVG